MNIIQLFLSFSGRINRKTYWLATLAFIVVYTAVDVIMVTNNGEVTGAGFLIMVTMIWPSLAVQTKRWHDRNKSGWWNLIGFIPVLGPLWAFIELGFIQGSPGSNIYGYPMGNRIPDEPIVPSAQPVNPYLNPESRESEFVGTGAYKTNSWRGM